MEDNEWFNCGRGAVFTREGGVELEASVSFLVFLFLFFLLKFFNLGFFKCFLGGRGGIWGAGERGGGIFGICVILMRLLFWFMCEVIFYGSLFF